MKRSTIISAAILVLLPLYSVFAGESDKQAVTKVVEEAYVQGVHANPSGDAMRKGFHKDFIMFIQDKGEIRKVTRDEWIARVEANNAKSNGETRPKISHKFPQIDITGNAAVVKVELYRDGKHIFSDYISLYKFDDGWKLIGKIFCRHPN